jgi:ribonuclease P protein component
MSPIRFVFLEMDNTNFSGVQVLVSVPKKRFKLAVSRNRIRRMISEGYRLKSQDLQQKIQSKSTFLALAIIYNGNEIPNYHALERVMESALQRIESLIIK